MVAVASAATRRSGDFYGGLRAALSGMLASPEFLFRIETATADRGGGAPALDPYAKASRLSYFLWNSAPDDALLLAAQRGDLDTQAGLARQVDRLMRSPRLQGGVRAFFSDMLGLEAFNSLAKDSATYPRFSAKVAQDAREETLRVIVDHLVARNGDYRDLFTTRRTFLTRALALVYRVPVRDPVLWTPYEFGEGDHRSGLLTRLGFLTLNAHPGRSSATLRGKAVRELILCQDIPTPPANVSFSLVQDTANPQFRTARARLDRHSNDPTCAGCHGLMDPIGFPMEQFDSIGEFRARENGAVIDTAGSLDGQAFDDVAGLGQALHDNPQTSSCLVDRTYSYAIGRAATPQQKAFRTALKARFAQDGYRFPGLLRAIALSEDFYRMAPLAPADPTPRTATAAAQPGRKG